MKSAPADTKTETEKEACSKVEKEDSKTEKEEEKKVEKDEIKEAEKEEEKKVEKEEEKKVEKEEEKKVEEEKGAKKKFMFNIADGGFTELHTLWLNEEQALKPLHENEVWHRKLVADTFCCASTFVRVRPAKLFSNFKHYFPGQSCWEGVY